MQTLTALIPTVLFLAILALYPPQPQPQQAAAAARVKDYIEGRATYVYEEDLAQVPPALRRAALAR